MSAVNSPRTTLIVNPAAAGGRVGARWADVERTLRGSLGECAFVVSQTRGDIPALVQRALDGGAETLVSLGGDGTHGEVLGGLMAARGGASSRPRFGVLHAGTGGDFARMLVAGAGASLEVSARALLTAESAAIDVGSIDYVGDDGAPASRYFLNLASVGVSGRVARLVNGSSKRLGGRLTFFLATLRALWGYEPARVRLTIDGEDLGEHAIATVTVCNGRFAGGGMMFAPSARLADGLLDVVLIRPSSLLRAALDSRALYRGTHVHSPRVACWRGREIVIEPVGREPALVDIDGESPGRAPAHFRAHPGAVEVLGARREFL